MQALTNQRIDKFIAAFYVYLQNQGIALTTDNDVHFDLMVVDA